VPTVKADVLPSRIGYDKVNIVINARGRAIVRFPNVPVLTSMDEKPRSKIH
jgi:hypothetical protein